MKKVLPVLTALLLLLASCVTYPGVVVVDDVTPAYADWSWLKSLYSTIYVNLEANATTGYEWTVSIDGESIVLTDEYYTAPAESMMVGVPGEWSAELSAVTDGVSIVTFTYSRPWDMSDVADVVSIMVTVDEGIITSVVEL